MEMTQGDRIRLIRKSENLTMEKFGEKLGVTKVAISLIENGSRSLTTQMLRAISNIYNVNEEWLRTGKGEMYAEISDSELIMERLGRVHLAKMSTEGKEAYYAVMKERFASAILAMDDIACQTLIDLLNEAGFTYNENTEDD